MLPQDDPAKSKAAPRLDDQDEVTAKLESLDDVIFSAIEGNSDALAASDQAWTSAVTELGPEVVKESRKEYLRYARATWDFLYRQSTRQPYRILAVLKIIAMLMDSDS